MSGVFGMVEQALEATAKAPRTSAATKVRTTKVGPARVGTTGDAVDGTAHVGGSEPLPDASEGLREEVAGVAKRTAPGSRKRDTVALRAEGNGDVQLGFLSDCVGFHLRLAQDASYRTFAKHHDKDLIKPGRYPALAIIHLNPGISQSALGRAIARDKSTVSPLIKDLQKNGFISRKASTQDRRSVTLVLTKKGERTLDELRVRATEHEAELDRLVGPSKARLMSLLGKIIASMSP